MYCVCFVVLDVHCCLIVVALLLCRGLFCLFVCVLCLRWCLLFVLCVICMRFLFYYLVFLILVLVLFKYVSVFLCLPFLFFPCVFAVLMCAAVVCCLSCLLRFDVLLLSCLCLFLSPPSRLLFFVCLIVGLFLLCFPLIACFSCVICLCLFV